MIVDYGEFIKNNTDKVVMIIFVPIVDDYESIENLLTYNIGAEVAEDETPDGTIKIYYVALGDGSILNNEVLKNRVLGNEFGDVRYTFINIK